ncbi:MAG: hypothetical protein ACOYMG_02995 [Candidatus Methylumidiphilus sp.]
MTPDALSSGSRTIAGTSASLAKFAPNPQNRSDRLNKGKRLRHGSQPVLAGCWSGSSFGAMIESRGNPMAKDGKQKGGLPVRLNP